MAQSYNEVDSITFSLWPRMEILKVVQLMNFMSPSAQMGGDSVETHGTWQGAPHGSVSISLHFPEQNRTQFFSFSEFLKTF